MSIQNFENNVENQLTDGNLNYNEIVDVLRRMQSSISVAELHGVICGFVCAGAKMDGRSWLEPVLGLLEPVGEYLAESRKLLLHLYYIAAEQLKDDAFHFCMLLPTGDVTLKQRAEAIGEWCIGVTTGLGMAGIQVDDDMVGDVAEAMNHLSEIARIDYENLEYNEEDERAYIEVVEHIRIVMMMLYTELVMGETLSREIVVDHGSLH